MRFSPSRPLTGAARRRQGVALIIVLAFVVLLTGLIIAFFSRSISERQISNSSVGQVKIDLYTQGAIMAITDDLKQEIAAGSNATVITDATSAKTLATVYVPSNGVTGAPAPALKGQSTVTAFAPNLVKRSAYKQNFFPGSGDTNANYYNDTSNNTVTTVLDPPKGTPAPSVAPARPPSNRATNLSTTTASQNGRSITAARWNKALLLPRDSSILTDPAKVDPLTTAFVAPDWILSTRDGSNPGSSTSATLTWGPTQSSSVNNPSPANPGFVTGRYAYTIYNEGGLLDANVAGYPTLANKYPSSGATSLPVWPTLKAALAYADLTVPITLPDGSPQVNLLTPTQVNTLVGWRNNASSEATGTFPNFTPAPTASPVAAASPYASPTYNAFDLAMLNTMDGFMGVSRYKTLSTFNQSDRTFGSRQELINFFTTALPSNPADKPGIAALENSLQYFGTFSRGFNQPSYAPVPRAASQNPRPLIQPSKLPVGGGNNVGDNYTKPEQQDVFSPNLLSLRVEPPLGGGTQWKRNDDKTPSVVGEPLLKSRFALQRLAWLTFAGPIAASANADGSNARLNPTNIQAITDHISILENTYGFTDAYLKKGTAANIQRYFGLYWDATAHRWSYSCHNGGNTSLTAINAIGPITKLQDVPPSKGLADLGLREPDFFEILKASVDVGALGKAGTNGPLAQGGDTGTPPMNTHFQALNNQFYRDVNVDAAIIQLGANIIDQYDLDGYPTRIVFNDNTGDREIHGVENLPYIYRVRLGGLKVRESNPPSTNPPNGNGAYPPPTLHSGTYKDSTGKTVTPAPLRDTGAGVVMAVPDIWNPHDQNSSLGNPRPGAGTTPLIRLVANSVLPEDIVATDPTSTVPPAAPTVPLKYNTFTSGIVIGTDATYGGMSASTPTGFSAHTPDAGAQANPSAAPEPIPYFTRAGNTDGKLASPAQAIMSGTNGGFVYPHPIDTATSSLLQFKVPDQYPYLYREPTMLGIADPSGPSGLTMVVDNNNWDVTKLTNSAGAAMFTNQLGLKSVNPLNGNPPNPLALPTTPPATQAYCGITLGTYPLRFVGKNWPGAPAGTVWHYTAWSLADTGTPTAAVTYSLQFQDPLAPSKWISYDDKYVDSDLSFVKPWDGALVQPKGGAFAFADPRTSRLGSASENNIADAAHYRAPMTTANWLDTTKVPIVVTERPDVNSGFGSNFRGLAPYLDWGGYASPGLHTLSIGAPGAVNAIFFQTGLLAQNDPYYASDGKRYTTDGGLGTRDANFISDADGVVRRAMGAFVSSPNKIVGNPVTGQPLATATTYTAGLGKPGTTPTQTSNPNPNQSQSRPIVLNRPFRTVGELGYVFSGNPWKNIDFSTPESAYSELLDVFCANDNTPADGLVAGVVDLNTRNTMVLKSILTGAYTDEANNLFQTPPTGVGGYAAVKPLLAQDAEAIAAAITARTSQPAKRRTFSPGTAQPFQNVGDLVGRWGSNQTITGAFNPALGVHGIDGANSYDGLGDDITNLTNLSTGMADALKISRVRESAVRALSNVGNTRVWNLMIDVIAQSGRYPPGVTALKSTGGADNFIVDGEQRYWVHLAIDRYTGAVLDTKLELVKE